MILVFEAFWTMLVVLYNTFNTYLSFYAFGMDIGIMDVMIGFIALTMVVSVFWRGAKG